MDYVIGVDIGTQSTKAILVDANGKLMEQHAQGYWVDTPRPMWAEQWPSVWLDAVQVCVSSCMRASGVAPERVKAICISSLYGGSGIPVDAEIQPLHPCLIWMDRRANEEVAWVKANVDIERLYSITGNSVDSYYGFTKMLWLKRNRPKQWAETRYLLPPNSYANWCLTGEIAIDHSSAGNIGGIYDMEHRCWSTEMLDALGIPADKMPQRLIDSGDVVGGLLPVWADKLGLQAGMPVMGGGVDAAMATLASGATRRGNHVAMIGTSMCWGYLNEQTDAKHGLISMPHVFNGKRDIYIFGGAITAGASVSWFRDQICEMDERDTMASGEDAHSVLERSAAEVPPGSDGVMFLPYLMGERSPVWDSEASGVMVGLNLYHNRSHLYRAILEGVIYALRHNIETGAKGAPELDPRLIVVGGASRSDLWMQIIADITAYPVYTIEEDVEASLGAALVAARGVGMIDDEQVMRGWVKLNLRASPIPANVKLYDDAFQHYLALYPALKPIMHGLRTSLSRASKELGEVNDQTLETSAS
jgi:sugar (pentulose or hexulose) kinase